MRFALTKERKLLLAGGALVLLLGLIYNLAPRFADWEARDEALDLQRDTLARYRRIIAEKDALGREKRALEGLLRRSEAGLLDAKTPALAAVEIQKGLQDLAARLGAEVKSMRQREAASPDEDAPYRPVSVEVTLAASIGQLVEMLHAVETDSRVQRVLEMTLRAAAGRDEGAILATLTIEGFMRNARQTED